MSCAALILASFIVSIILQKEIGYPLQSYDSVLTTTYAFYLAVTNLCIATYLYNAAPELPPKSKSVPDSIGCS